jgi:(E)-4-hydroxy-3-methylbut-2-enyl-diphosphate synthase
MTDALLASRRKTRQINVGPVTVGGDAPISVQTMTKTDTRDIDATVAQIAAVAEIGCDIVRLAVPDREAADALPAITEQASIPVIADIHFDHKLALAALESGVDALRINPGNIGGEANVREVVQAAGSNKVPIRIGVNSGSVEKELLAKHGGPTPEALVESAMKHVRILEDIGYHEIKVSVKASDVARTVAAYRLLTKQTDYPLHLGVTEAGTLIAGTVSSSVAMGILLTEGIGDTIRVSLTDDPRQEVRAGLALLRSLGLRGPGPTVISCPTCGRTEMDIVGLAADVEAGLERYYIESPTAPRPVVAVMGCIVNGPGEAQHADIAICGGKGKAALYVRGKHIQTLPETEVLASVLKQVRNWQA